MEMPKFKTPFANEMFEALVGDMDAQLEGLQERFSRVPGGAYAAALLKMVKRHEMLLGAVETAHRMDIQERSLQAQLTVAGIAMGQPAPGGSKPH